MPTRADRLQAVTSLLWQRKARQRRSDKGEVWIDHLCVFHDDRERSATWQPETGVYHCWAEDRTYSLDEVEGELKVVIPRPSPPRAYTTPTQEKSRQVISQAFYDYTYPDGRPSHTHLRTDYDDGSKEMPFRGPDASPGRPKEFWPIYDESRLGPGQVLFVVEGEKCVDWINSVDDIYLDHPVRALTAGSASELKKYAPVIAKRLQDLTPSLILLWPDNDDPGQAAMRSIKSLLDTNHIACAIVDPMRYDLGHAEDAADFLQAGQALSLVISDYSPSLTTAKNGATTKQAQVAQLVNDAVMLNADTLIFPGTQTPVKIESSVVDAYWLNAFGQHPQAQVSRELKVRLTEKGLTSPTDVAFRHLAIENAFWWKALPDHPSYRVTADQLILEDPPNTLVIVPRSRPRYDPTVDLDGSLDDFNELCQMFQLSELARALVLTWLISAFTGRKTPILLLKGQAATGKTTLASFLCALIDPDVPTMNAQQAERDTREFIRTAQRHPALLLDNVSSVKSDFEDALSKLVTGETAALRTLYGDVIETIHLQRAIAVTTTTWDISKGDLATRMWPIEPKLDGSFMDEEDVDAVFGPLLARVRGYIFRACQTYYQRTNLLPNQRTSLRIGGRVLATLGYDVEAVSSYINALRAQVIVEGEPWLDALVELWNEVASEGPYRWSPTEICKYLGDKTHDEPSAKVLANFIRPRQALFPNYGFSLIWGRTPTDRYYEFRAVDPRSQNLPLQPAWQAADQASSEG